MPRLWKVLTTDRQPTVSGSTMRYPADGKWTRHLSPAKLAVCQWGYHYCEGRQILGWLREGLLCEIEPCPEHEPLRA